MIAQPVVRQHAFAHDPSYPAHGTDDEQFANVAVDDETLMHTDRQLREPDVRRSSWPHSACRAADQHHTMPVEGAIHRISLLS
jgi:hypothetical protein